MKNVSTMNTDTEFAKEELIGMDSIFSNLNETDVVSTETDESTKSRKEKVAILKEALDETILTNPNYLDIKNSLSNSVEVINSLGFGDSGNIVVDKSRKGDERALAVTSQIVGYRLRNIGNASIVYTTEVWTAGENGVYESTKVEKTLEVGSTVDLARQYMTIFCARPEISFTLANGKIIRGSGARTANGVKEELESYYFRFNKDASGEQPQINDDSIKLNVGEKVNDKWVVKPEFVDTFGFLNNTTTTKGTGKKSDKERYTAQDLAANFVNRLIAEAGL